MIVHETAFEDDPDSYEVQVRQADQQDFAMAPILAGHADRLRAADPYRVPSPLWRSRTPDVPTPIAPLFLPASRDPTPFSSYGWSETPSMLRDPTPNPYPPPDLRPQLPVLRQHSPAPSAADLFAPGASFVRDPTPQAQKRAHQEVEEHSEAEDAPLAPSRSKRARKEEEPDDKETDGEEFEPPKSSLFLAPEPDTDEQAKQELPVSVFLDMAADDSDEEREDGEEDLEETLSDQGSPFRLCQYCTNSLFRAEFLDDTPQQEFPYTRPMPDVHPKEPDNALALARYYEQRAKDERDNSNAAALPPVEPARSTGARISRREPIKTATWVRGRCSPVKGEIVFVLSPSQVLYVPSTHETWLRFREKTNVKQWPDCGFTMTRHGHKAFTNYHYKLVPRPSPQELFPYYRCTNSLLLSICCPWPTPAFAEPRTRVVAIDGPHKGRAGIIVRLVDAEVEGAIIKWAEVKRITADPTGDHHRFGVRLDHLERHMLDPCYRFHPHDSVRVVDGALYNGVLGHVLELQDQRGVELHEEKRVVTRVTDYAGMIVDVPLDCDVIGLAEPTPRWPGLKTFKIPISFAMREFHLGDLVEVKLGEHTGRIGAIVILEGARWVRMCDLRNFVNVCTLLVWSGLHLLTRF